MATTTTDPLGLSFCDAEHCPAVLDNMEKEFIDGVLYIRAWLPIPCKEMLENVKVMEILDDDVITIGVPRSGNHWAFELVHMIRNQTTNFCPTSFAFNLLEHRNATPGALDLEAFPPPRNPTTHLRPNLLPDAVVKKRTKIIFLLRNPKDVFYSSFLLWSRTKHLKDRYIGTWDEFIDLQFSGYFLEGSWFDNILVTEKFMDDHPEVPVYIHVFEEMKENPVESVRKMCQFLEMPDDKAEEIAAAIGFQNMKSKAKKFDEIEDVLFLGKDNPTLLRKGEVGDWKNHFTVAQNERFNEFYRKKMANSKLARRVEKYLDL